MTGNTSVTAQHEALPGWAALVRAPNPGAMTLEGTNTWVLRAPGARHAVVVDPGPDHAGHLARIVAHGPVSHILVTHGHHDHVEGAARLSALLDGVPVLAVNPAHRVGDAPPTGRIDAAGLVIDVLDTPGHTADSVCFAVGPAGAPGTDGPGGQRAVLTGDTILGRGTAVVAWPDGDLAAYLASLEALTAFAGVPALPGHGPPLADCGAAARAYLAHRRDRLEQVRAAVAAGARTPEAVVARVYPDVDPAVRFAAEWSVRAQLDHLGHTARESGHRADRLDPL